MNNIGFILEQYNKLPELYKISDFDCNRSGFLKLLENNYFVKENALKSLPEYEKMKNIASKIPKEEKNTIFLEELLETAKKLNTNKGLFNTFFSIINNINIHNFIDKLNLLNNFSKRLILIIGENMIKYDKVDFLDVVLNISSDLKLKYIVLTNNLFIREIFILNSIITATIKKFYYEGCLSGVSELKRKLNTYYSDPVYINYSDNDNNRLLLHVKEYHQEFLSYVLDKIKKYNEK